MSYQFVFDANNQLIDVRTAKDVGSPPLNSVIISIEKPSDDQLANPKNYHPNPTQDGLEIKEVITTSLSEEDMQIQQQSLKQQFSQVLTNWQNRIALHHDYRSIDQAILNNEAFKQWDMACREKAINLKQNVSDGTLPLSELTPQYFINQMPKLEDYL